MLQASFLCPLPVCTGGKDREMKQYFYPVRSAENPPPSPFGADQRRGLPRRLSGDLENTETYAATWALRVPSA